MGEGLQRIGVLRRRDAKRSKDTPTLRRLRLVNYRRSGAKTGRSAAKPAPPLRQPRERDRAEGCGETVGENG
jgi:hypothetical protein